MNDKLFIFALLTATLLSSAMAVNVPVYAGEDRDDDSNGRSILQAKNDDGQQSFGINECSNTQKDFENSNNNVQNLDCDILINNLQDVRDTTNTVGNVNEGGQPEPEPEPVLTCEECFEETTEEIRSAIIVETQLSIGEVCEGLEDNQFTLAELEEFLLLVLGTDAAADIDALIECLEEALA